MGKAKIMAIIGMVLILISIVGFTLRYFALSYPWKREVHDYFELAWDSGTLKEKATYLRRFLTELENRGLTEGQAVIFFPTPRTDMKEQYNLLKALVVRMEDGLELEINSLEYQYLMRQIEENEIDYVNSDIFFSGWKIKSGWWLRSFIFGWLLIIGVIFLTIGFFGEIY